MRKLSTVLALILLMGSVTAFPSSVERLDPKASPDDPAVIQVNVQNNYSSPVTFKVGSFSPQPSWVYVEQSETLQPGENGTIRVTVTPGEYAIDNTYSMTLYVKASNTKHSHTVETSFNVERDRKIILEDFSLAENKLDPGETVKGSLKIRSISSQVLNDYSAFFSYDNYSTTSKSSPILPGGTRTLEFSLPVNEKSRPEVEEVVGEVMVSGEIVATSSDNFTVSEIRDIDIKTSNNNNLLSITGSVSVTNRGNAPVNYTVNRTVASYLTPITAFSKLPDRKEDTENGERYYWNINLEPGEKFTLERQTNYWVPIAALIGIIVALVGIKKLRNSVRFSKEVEEVEDGLRVSINVENISDRTFRNVKVEDFVPDIADVNRNFDMAAPHVRKTNEGTKLSWDLEELESGDQRVLQYTIRPKVEVEGGVELQKAKLMEGEKVIKKSEKESTQFNP